MFTSLEIRWFYHGTPSPEIERWFNQDCVGQQLHSPEKRQDLYLYSNGCEDVGIKLRQGKLEIKWRKTELGVISFGDRLQGKIEKWTKWICEDPTDESFRTTNMQGKPGWVSVEKVRSQRRYQNCNFELTLLNIRGHHWWSLAGETFGKDANLIDNLESVTNLILKTYPASLQAETSFAYPKWLSLVFA